MAVCVVYLLVTVSWVDLQFMIVTFPGQIHSLFGLERFLPISVLGLIHILKAAYSVTFDLLILELMFLFFKNTVK